ncbi:hypothetical protein OKA04_09590 [Luteolibacter flavescens]|uniref:DUF3592 domain-containing protein n=1 Tax=Luteolibacter flavescens TaxID=1859460 RepID=A0ABT3FN28_9BACT|nr:hypothetical protein [Luteolibacter flavescens]MCW1884978.1 hypothetical protein [Luteolibacter flavescens]
MQPRPLHRWKSFWLGVFVLIFFGWAWVRSMGIQDTIEWISPKRGIHGLVHVNSRLIIFQPVDATGMAPEFDWSSRPNKAYPDPRWFPAACTWTPAHDDVAGRFTISHWLLTLSFAVPWAAFLAWRRRRMRGDIGSEGRLGPV